MKKTLLIAVAILLFAMTVNAAPGTAYIGVFKDAGHLENFISPTTFAPFDVWIWILPGVLGVQAAEFGVVFPATVVTTNTIQNPDITVALGSLTGGISVAYGTCQNDWTFTHHLTCISLAAAPGTIALVGDASVSPPIFAIATCELGYPTAPVIYFTPLYLYNPGPVGVQQSTWGAIKNMF
jgi:hypothetical protein